jgi:hypothetical protein
MSIVQGAFAQDDIENFIEVARSINSIKVDDPRRQRAIFFMLGVLKSYESLYIVLERGPNMTMKDRDRIMKHMEDLYKKNKMVTLSIWLSKESCPHLSVQLPE